MTDFDYKKYSLENLEKWIEDALSSAEASPQEIYDTIRKVVSENYYHHKYHTSRAYELLTLLNGNNNLEEQVRAHGELWDKEDTEAIIREREYYDKRAELDSKWKSVSVPSKPLYVSEDGDVWIPDNDVKEDRVVKWQLPVEVDGISGECYIQFPDDLMEAAGIKEDDLVEWIDRKDGSFELRKVTKPIGMEEC